MSYNLGFHVSAMIKCISNNDLLGAKAHCKAMKGSTTKNDEFTKFSMNLAFVDLFNLPIETEHGRHVLAECLDYLREIFGEAHIVISDIYSTISDLYSKKGYFSDALDFAGEALLVRVNRCGIIHEKTADSHYCLGILYRRLNDPDKARRELNICRSIRCKLYGDHSLQVALCDIQIGHLEMTSDCAIAAYVSYYKCYRCRYLLLGNNHRATREAEELAITHNKVKGERLVCAMELKQRIHELQWLKSETSSWQYSVAIFVGRLNMDDAFSQHQVKSLVATAVKFSKSRLGPATAPLYTNDNSYNISSPPLSPALAPPSYLAGMEAQQQQRDEINSLTSLLMIVSKPVVLPYHSHHSSSSPSPVKSTSNGASSHEKKSFQSPSLSSSCDKNNPPPRSLAKQSRNNENSNTPLSNSNFSDRNISNISHDLLTPTTITITTTRDGISPEQQKLSINSCYEEENEIQDEDEEEDGFSYSGGDCTESKDYDKNNNHLDSKSSRSSTGKIHGTTRAAAAHVNDVYAVRNLLELLPADTSAASIFESATKSNNKNNNSKTNYSVIHKRAVESQNITSTDDNNIGTDASNGNSAAAATTTVIRPYHWRPIKSPFHSLAWSQYTKQSVQSLPFALGTASASSPGDALFARDKDGVLLLINRANRSTLRETLKLKLLALAIFPWLASKKNNSLSLAHYTNNSNHHSNVSKGSANHSSNSSVNGSSSSNKDGLRGSVTSAGSVGSSGGSSLKRRNSMNNCIRNSSISSENIRASIFALDAASASSVTSASAAAKKKPASIVIGPVWDKVIPLPPPVPTTWPPVPYTGYNNSGDGSTLIHTAGGSSERGTLSSLSSLGGGSKKPRLKQIYLANLPSIEGTLWAEPTEISIASEDLFDDLEEEFLVGKTKTKKSVPFGRSSSGRWSKSPLLHNGRKSTTSSSATMIPESVLDPQRAQNINIMLAKFGKRSYFDIAELVKNFDVDKLGPSTVSSLMQYVPSEEETVKVNAFVLKKYLQQQQQQQQKESLELDSKQEHDSSSSECGVTGEDTNTIQGNNGTDRHITVGPQQPQSLQAPIVAATISDITATILQSLKLGKAEQYIFIFSQVSMLETRLTAMNAISSALETSQNILSSAEIILNAVNEVRGSGRLRFLLKSFLDLSNALIRPKQLTTGDNETQSSSAMLPLPMTGIRLESLVSRITMTKTNSGETVEQYAVNKIANHFPDALNVSSDMPSLDDARQVQFQRLTAELKKLADGIALLKKIIAFDISAAAAVNAASITKRSSSSNLGALVQPTSGINSADSDKSTVSLPNGNAVTNNTLTASGLVAAAVGSEFGITTNSAVLGLQPTALLLATTNAITTKRSPSSVLLTRTNSLTSNNTTTITTTAANITMIQKSLEQAEKLYARAHAHLAEAQRDFADLCRYFGEDATVSKEITAAPPVGPDKLFGQIIQFVRGIQTAGNLATMKQRRKASMVAIKQQQQSNKQQQYHSNQN